MKKLALVLLLLPFISCTSPKANDIGIDSLITLRENERSRKLDNAKFLVDEIKHYDLKKKQGFMSDREYKVVVDPLKADLKAATALLDSTELAALKDHQKVH